MSQFLHGSEVVQIDGPVPVETQTSNVVHLTAVADDADATLFPEGQNVLVQTSPDVLAKCGDTGTLAQVLDAHARQGGVTAIVNRVATGATVEETRNNIVGGLNPDGTYRGMAAAVSAEADVGVAPRLFIAPGYADNLQVINKQIELANKLRGFSFADVPADNEADAITFRNQFGSKRLMLVNPTAGVRDRAGDLIDLPGSAIYCAKTVETDRTLGFTRSPSNKSVEGVESTARPMIFVDGDPNTNVQLLNGNEISTFIQRQRDGWRTYGNRSASNDPQWAFMPVVRAADIINDSILRATHIYVDGSGDLAWASDILGSVRQYLRGLVTDRHLLGARAWLDPVLNTPEVLAAGQIYINFDFTVPAPGERITFQSFLVNDYYVQILPLAA